MDIFTPRFSNDVVEPGYALLNLIVRLMFDNVYYVFFFSALLIILPLWHFFKRSPYFLLSIFLYLTIGTYFEGFNIMRQMIAASLALYAFDYIKHERFVKYCLSVFIACMFQWNAICLIPAYFFMRQSKKGMTSKVLVRKLVFILLGIMAILFVGKLSLFYINHYLGGDYEYAAGISVIPWTNAIIPTGCIILCEVLLYMNKNHKKYQYPRTSNFNITDADFVILENGSIIWYILEICRLQIPLMTRFASFFSPYIIMLIPLLIYNIRDRKIKTIILASLVIFLYVFMMSELRNDPINMYKTIFN